MECPKDDSTTRWKWAYITKVKNDGSLNKYKARLVAKGYDQHEDVDYFEIFSTIVKPQTTIMMFSFTLARNWNIRQLVCTMHF